MQIVIDDNISDTVHYFVSFIYKYHDKTKKYMYTLAVKADRWRDARSIDSKTVSKQYK